jgi:hypothetical protein
MRTRVDSCRDVACFLIFMFAPSARKARLPHMQSFGYAGTAHVLLENTGRWCVDDRSAEALGRGAGCNCLSGKRRWVGGRCGGVHKACFPVSQLQGARADPERRGGVRTVEGVCGGKICEAA